MTRIATLLISLGILAGCGLLVPGTPGHEPALGGNYNPISREFNNGTR